MELVNILKLLVVGKCFCETIICSTVTVKYMAGKRNKFGISK
jgi:hypothetical protein